MTKITISMVTKMMKITTNHDENDENNDDTDENDSNNQPTNIVGVPENNNNIPVSSNDQPTNIAGVPENNNNIPPNNKGVPRNVDKITTVDNNDDDTDARNQILNLEEEMDDVYGTHLRTNLRTRKRIKTIPVRFTNNSCANYRDKQSRTHATVAAQLHALSSIQDLK